MYREAAKTRKNERRRILGAVSNIAFGPRPQGEKKEKKIHGTLSRSILHTCKHANVLFCKTLLLTMVIFVLLIWLWVWCNAVAGYFVPSSFPSSFRPLLSRHTRRYFYCEARATTLHDDGSPACPLPPQILFHMMISDR